MRRLISLCCLTALAAVLAGAARGADGVGTLYVERGKGTVTLDVRGVVLGRLANGLVTITDRTPNDPHTATVTGRRIQVYRRLGPNRIQVRGQGLRFRMLGGNYRIVVRGVGISVSAVGRGLVVLDGEPRLPGEDLGVYSLDGVDCSMEPENCVPIPDEAVRLRLLPEEPARPGTGAR